MKKRKPRSVRKPTRYMFMQDDDGHTYLIPADKKNAFETWCENAPYWDGYEGEWFDKYAIGCSISHYTFTDPKEA